MLSSVLAAYGGVGVSTDGLPRYYASHENESLPVTNAETRRHCEGVLADAALGLRGGPRAEQGKRVKVQTQPAHRCK